MLYNNLSMGDIIKDTFDGALVYVRPLNEPPKVDPESIMIHDKIMESVSKARKSMNNVLGIIEGPYFVPDGYSRNKRFYPKELWEEALKRVVPTLDKRAMVGTLEHPTTEEAAHPKNASHVVKKLYIGKDGRGYGKSYILNTPMGSLVFVLGSARDEEGNPIVPLYMSSRGLGKISGYTRDGYEIVDPKSYILESFDVVLDPGFLVAKPNLSEVVESVLPEIKKMEEGRERFFISLLESIPSLEVGDEESTGYEGPPSGFINDEPSLIEESPVSEVSRDEVGLGLMEVINEKNNNQDNGYVEQTLGSYFDFTPVEEGLSERDLASFAQMVEKIELSGGGRAIQAKESLSFESYAGPSAAPPNKGGEMVQISQGDLSLLLEGYKALVDKVKYLEEEVKSLKIGILSSNGVSPSKAKRVLESNGWDLSLAREKLLESSSKMSKTVRKRHAETLESVSIESKSHARIEETKDSLKDFNEDRDLSLLESLLNRI